MQPNHDQQRGLFDDTKTVLLVLIWVVHALAVPYELVMDAFGSMGKRYLGMAAVVGVVFLFPLTCEALHHSTTPEQVAGLQTCWLALFVLAFLHRTGSLVQRRFVHPYSIGHFWLAGHGWRSQVGEFAAAAIGGALIGAFVAPGAGLYLWLGWFINRVHVALIDARFRRQAENALADRHEAQVFAAHVRDLDR